MSDTVFDEIDSELERRFGNGAMITSLSTANRGGFERARGAVLAHQTALARIPRVAAMECGQGVEHDGISDLPVMPVHRLGPGAWRWAALRRALLSARSRPMIRRVMPRDTYRTSSPVSGWWTAMGCSASGISGRTTPAAESGAPPIEPLVVLLGAPNKYPPPCIQYIRGRSPSAPTGRWIRSRT